MTIYSMIVCHVHDVKLCEDKSNRRFALITVRVTSQNILSYWKVFLRGAGVDEALKLAELDIVCALGNAKFEIWQLDDNGQPRINYALFADKLQALQSLTAPPGKPQRPQSPDLFAEQN